MVSPAARARTLFRAALAFILLASFGSQSVAALDQAQVVILVRHAEKAAAPKGDVALSDAGLVRAEALAAALADAHVDAIVTTQLRRTRETAAPLAAKRHLTPVVVPTGENIDAHARAVAEALRDLGPVVLVVGHSDSVPAIIHALGGPSLPALCETQYAQLFTMVTMPGKPPRLVRSTYGAPDPPVPSDCANTMMTR
jgi:broad specificity phosphatase PhoE